MQPAQPLHALCRGSQHQVIGVAQQDIGSRGRHLFHRQRLHRPGGTHRHEGRGADIAARGGQHPRARLAVSGVDREWKRAHQSALQSRLASP